jgi:hypothetical protein
MVTRLRRDVVRLSLILLGSLLLPACSDSDDVLLPPTTTEQERAYFDQHVIPIFESKCGLSACHAASADRFEKLDTSYFLFPVDDDGQVAGSERRDKAHERALEKISAESAKFSDLVRKPLHESLGGQVHRGGDQFLSMDEETLHTVMKWAEMAKPPQPEEVPAVVARYRDEIQPILANKTCMLSSCHGASSANLLIFDPGFLGEFDSGSTTANYKKVQLHMNFETPEPMLSRLVRKAIPLDQGGIPHRGGNAFFDPSSGDADLQVILDFVTAVRADLGDDDKGVATGVVFVATDPTPRNLFDISAWQPGGDVYSLVPAEPGGTLKNLTAGHHQAEADIRDPSVSYDGARVAFAMRRSVSDSLNLYVMNVDGSGLSQLTNDTGSLANGIKVANVEPLWGPDDRIYFTSTRVGKLSAHGGFPLANMWRIDADGNNPLQMTYNAGYEFSPGWRLFPAGGEERPEIRTLDLTFSATRQVGQRLNAPLMRVPPDFRADYHPHYGTQHPDYQIFTSHSQLPDQREPLVLMDEANLWEGGALALIDRNLGPVIKDGGKSAVVNYIPGLQKLGPPGEDVAHTGFSAAGYYRDPHAMPDGTVVVSYSAAPIDHADPMELPDPALYRLTLTDLPTNQRAIVTDRLLLVDVPGKVETDPAPMGIRRREEIGDPLHHVSNDVDTGTVLNFDHAVQLTVATEDSPSNTKDFEATAELIQQVRLVEEVLPSPSDYPNWPDTSQSRIGRGGHGIRRVLAEFAATDDRSMYVELPAGVPFYVQAVDNTGASTITFNQWFFALPGEKLKQVTRREVWNQRCGACHGSVSGVAGDTVAKPDILSEASRVIANYDVATDTDKAPVPHGIDAATRQQIDFEQHVQPILSQSCATNGCHEGGGVSPDLSQRQGNDGFSGSYEALTASGADSGNGFAYVDPVSSRARSSYLAEVLLLGDLEAPRDFDSNACRANERASAEDIALLMRWMDLGANYIGIAPNTAPTLPTY